MSTHQHHFIFSKNQEYNYSPILGKVFYENEKIIRWEDASFVEKYESIENSYNDALKFARKIQEAKVNFPIRANDDETLSYFHPNKEISFNKENEIELNYAPRIENSEVIKIDLDDEMLKMMESIGANTKTVEGVQVFYELLGDVFKNLIESENSLNDEEKTKLINDLKYTKK